MRSTEPSDMTRSPRQLDRAAPGGLGLVLVLVVTCSFYHCSGQETEMVATVDPGKKLEETVFTDMLKIVDHKFDTLTTRITALERAVSGLQFFSIRQFRQLSGSIQSTGNDLEAVSKQVGQLEVDGQGLKIAMSLLGRDMSELKTVTNDMLGELESSVVYINDNVEKQTQFLKTVMEDTMLRHANEVSAKVSGQLEEMERRQTAKSQNVNCTVDFSELNERIDLRFAEFKKQTHTHFIDLINAVKMDTDSQKTRDSEEIESVQEGVNKNQVEIVPAEAPRVNRAERYSPVAQTSSEHASPQSGPQASKAKDPTSGDSNDKRPSSKIDEAGSETQYSDADDQRIMNALYNMTGSVVQAVNYFRHTGRILEQIMSNTDVLLVKQSDLTARVEGLSVLRSPQLASRMFEVNNAIPSPEPSPGQEAKPYPSVMGSRSNDCLQFGEIAGNIATIIRNGSQLLEVLTDLAQMSSVSLTQATATLQDEVKRVEGVRTRMATTLMAHTTDDRPDPVSQLTNSTQQIFKLVEAVASNTGRLPLISRSVQHVQWLANRTLDAANRNNALLQNSQVSLGELKSKNIDNHKEAKATLTNRIPRVPGWSESTTATKSDLPFEEGVALDRDSLETIYSTSLQLHRIMPALTKLLAEPDPLFTLVGGGRPDRGRVEIYNKGHWGSICHTDLTHAEADSICTHLGFRGGISAGSGYFGPGAGMSWSLNASCLASGRCAAVVPHGGSATLCSHDLDASVICDHMLRIASSNESVQGTVGRLEIHHRGVWVSVCSEGWSGYSARVACQQMGFSDGREAEQEEWQAGQNTTWLSKVACDGTETRLDACVSDGWVDTCSVGPAGVRCL